MKTTNVMHAIAALNLDAIKNKLMDEEHGEGWSRAKVNAMEIEYKRFLHLMHAFPNQGASPTKAVDTFWHYHILDTQKYAIDCEAVFGCFMHHDPYGDQSAELAGASAGDRMRELYEATFGEEYIRADVYAVEAGATGAGSARNAASADVKTVCVARCHAFCMGITKAAAKTVCVARCHAFCMGITKAKAEAKTVCVARCHAFCMGITKGAPARKLASESNCVSLTTMEPQPSGSNDDFNQTDGHWQAKPVDISVQFA